MKNNSLIFATVAFVVLGIFFIKQQGDKKEAAPDVRTEKLILKEIPLNSVTRMKIHFPFFTGDTLELASRGTGWVMASRYDAPAKAPKMNRLLEAIGKLEGELRSDSAEVLADYGLAEESSLHLELYGNGDEELINLLIGNPAGNQEACFLRLAGSNRVLKIATPLRGILGLYGESRELPSVREWLNLGMMDFERSKAGKLILTAKGTTTKYIKKEGAKELPEEGKEGAKEMTEYVWEPEGEVNGTSKNNDEIGSIIGVLSNFHAEDVAGRGDLEKYGLKTAPYVAKVVSEDKKEYELRIGKKLEEGDNRYAAVGGSDLVYSIAKYQFESIFGKEDKK